MNTAAMRCIALILTLLMLGLGPRAAVAQDQVNPTELSVQEQQLLDALGGGEAVAGRVSIPNERAGDLIKPTGRDWSRFQTGMMFTVTLWSIIGMVVLLALFYFIRGRIRIESGWSGRTILRFGGIERFTHWLTAVSFILLALSGLNMVLGRRLLLPLMGGEAFGSMSALLKVGHNFLAWPFMLGIALMFVLWVKDNFPSRADKRWLAEGGGMLKKGVHPPARRFNPGQKLIFWAVVLGGAAMSITGFFLIFPALAGPASDWQFIITVHGLVAAALAVVILGHIYIGTLGMEGAFSAMGSGQVDVNWAKEHHSLWVNEKHPEESRRPAKGRVAPAE